MIIERPKPDGEEDFTGEGNQQPRQYKKSYRQQKLERTPQHRQEIEEKELDEVPMASAVADIDRIPLDQRPTAKVVREDGSTPRRRRAVSLGLSDLIIPPFTKARIAQYRMINDDRIDPSTGKKPEAPDSIIPGTYVLYDKFEADPLRRNKLMKNLGREEIIFNNDTQKEERKYNINDIEFLMGMKNVDIEKNYREYVFMELHPLNRSNRHRNLDNAPLFERVDIAQSETPAFKAAMLDLANDAENAVIKEVKDQHLIIGYAVQMGISVDGKQPGEIKNDLRVAARNNPKKFFSCFKDLTPAIKINIHDGLGKGIIEYNADKRRFEFTETGQVIHVVLMGEDPVNDFAAAIQKQPELMDVYQEMVDMLNYWV